jgi:hypothetical protein
MAVLIAAVALLHLQHAIPGGAIYKTWNMSSTVLRGTGHFRVTSNN